jgi:hypothetical protein
LCRRFSLLRSRGGDGHGQTSGGQACPYISLIVSHPLHKLASHVAPCIQLFLQ